MYVVTESKSVTFSDFDKAFWQAASWLQLITTKTTAEDHHWNF